jgi:NADPH-dependent 2,4-dienoyl-CoA reductase/sulfur reductase-like enzyme
MEMADAMGLLGLTVNVVEYFPEVLMTRDPSFGVKNAIHVNREMETSHPDIYAAGDCAETYHCLLNENLYLPLGTTAHKQGRIAGENAMGGHFEYAGSLGTRSVKIFGLVAARTGLKDNEARSEGFEAVAADFESWDHKDEIHMLFRERNNGGSIGEHWRYRIRLQILIL